MAPRPVCGLDPRRPRSRGDRSGVRPWPGCRRGSSAPGDELLGPRVGRVDDRVDWKVGVASQTPTMIARWSFISSWRRREPLDGTRSPASWQLAPVFTGKELLEPHVVDDHRVGLAQVARGCRQDLRHGAAHPPALASSRPSRITCSITVGWLPRRDVRVDLRPGVALVERNRPLDPLDAPDPVEVVLEHRLDVVDVPDRGSMTQRSAPVMSVIWPQVRSIRPQKIDPCCVIRSAANVSPRTIPGTSPGRRPASSARSRTHGHLRSHARDRRTRCATVSPASIERGRSNRGRPGRTT